MFDLKWLRDNPDAFDAALTRRGIAPAMGRIGAIMEERRAIETALQEDQARRNRLAKEFGQFKARGTEPPAELTDDVARLRDAVRAGEERSREIEKALEADLSGLPNILADEVPDGPDESHNVEIRRWGTPRDFNYTPRWHDELGERLGMDFKRAARMSGARFTVLSGPLARLERGLAAFMLDLQTREHGYRETSVPLLVRETALYGTSQLPKFADDLFRTTGEHWLVPTAEVPLTNLVADEMLDEAELPLRFTAASQCFRSEAGSAGRDTRGMIRQHQFTKVELVSVTTPETSAAEHERMTGCAEAVLQRLGLPYRVVLLCAGDTGFGATKTYDLEVWLPGQGAYREISSCSVCGDFQARRMNARYRPTADKRPRYVHTLNGSGLAVGRTLIAVLENYQEQDGSVTIPEALRPFVDGIDRLLPQG